MRQFGLLSGAGSSHHERLRQAKAGGTEARSGAVSQLTLGSLALGVFLRLPEPVTPPANWA